MATLAALRSNLRTEIKIDPTANIWADATLNRNLVQAVRQIQQDGQHEWPFNDGEYSVSTIISTGTYALPSDFVALSAGTIKYNGQPLLPYSYQKLYRENTSLAVDGVPAIYYLYGNNIGLFQRPNAVNTLGFLYRKKLVDMVADSDDDGLPNEFTEACIQYALYLTFNDIKGYEEKVAAAVSNYKLVLEGLNQQFLGRRDAESFDISMEVISDSNDI